MTHSRRPSGPALAPILLAALLGGEWGCVSVRPSVRLSVCLGPCGSGDIHTFTSQMGRLRQARGRTPVPAEDECLKRGDNERKGGPGSVDSVSPSVKWAKPRPSLVGYGGG